MTKQLNISHLNTRRPLLFIACMMLMSLVSCNNARYLAAGQKLYTGAIITLRPEPAALSKKERARLKSELKSLTRPKPNTKYLGARAKLWLYNIAGKPKKKGLSYLIKTSLGEPPILFGDVDVKHNEDILKNRLENEGYFMPAVIAKAVEYQPKKIEVEYIVDIGKAYTIRKVIFPAKDSSINRLLYATRKESILKPGDQFSLDSLKKERERINNALKIEGLYYFTPDDLVFMADSTAGDHQVDIYLRIKRRIPLKATRVYTLNNIYVFADHRLFNDSVRRKQDTVMVQGYYYIKSNNIFRPDIIVSSIFLEKDSVYNFDDYEITLNRLMRLGIYKFVNINFKDLDTLHKTGKLDTYIYLTPLPTKSIKIDFRMVSKSDNFTGPLLNLSLKDRNVFHGAETLTFNVNGSIETILTGQGHGLTSSTIGGNVELAFPRFITPFFEVNPPTKFVPQTQLSLGFQKLIEVQYYDLNTYNFSAGYRWNQSDRISHVFDPIVISFLKLGHTSSLFDTILNRNPSLKRSFATQFVIGSYYSYIYNTRATPGRKVDFYFNGTADVSGNALGLVQSAFKDYDESPGHPYTILGEPYSQYALGTLDFVTTLNMSKENKLLGRLFAGAGLPYGNSQSLPFIKEFFTGGNNSVRAFQTGFLGPGGYKLPPNPSPDIFIDQVGDMKLEGNIEYRFPIAGLLKGAIFTDAGNIWLVHNDTARPGGQFHVNTFYQQIAVGSGFGLRLDASFFVLRFDLAFPLRRPYPTDGDYWVFKEMQPLSPVWRNNNLVLNIGIGYPF